jgi:hypothetical protein
MPAHPLPSSHRASSFRVSAWLCGWLCLFGLLGLACGALAQPAATPLPLTAQGIHTWAAARLFLAGDDSAAPADAAALPAWLARQRPAADVDLFGGAYWLLAQVRNDSSETAWVIDPNDTLIDLVDIHVYGPGQHDAPRTLLTGYQRPHEYLLHYGKNVQLAPGATYAILIRFSSPYYARAHVRRADAAGVPQAGGQGKLPHRRLHRRPAGAGPVQFLHLFHHPGKSLGVLRAVRADVRPAWAMTFHVFADLFDWHHLQLRTCRSSCCPSSAPCSTCISCTCATIRPCCTASARSTWCCPCCAAQLLLRAAVCARLATIAISLWMLLALTSGIVVWRRGYQPARFFVLAFVALMLPGFLILPANLG